MKRSELWFLALSAAAAAIPGMKLLTQENWWPPEAPPIFRLVAAVVAAVVLCCLYLVRARIASLRPRRALALSGSAFAGAFLLLWNYGSDLHHTVVGFQERNVPTQAFVPLFRSQWIDDDLLRLIRMSVGPARKSLARGSVTTGDLKAAYEKWGSPLIDQRIPQRWKDWTVALLLVKYSASLALLALGFGLVFLRLDKGEGGDEHREDAGEEGAPAPVAAEAAPAQGAGAPAAATEARLELLELRASRVHAELLLAELERARRELDGHPDAQGNTSPQRLIGSLVVSAAAGWIMGFMIAESSGRRRSR